MKWKKGWQHWEALRGVTLDVFFADGDKRGRTVLVSAGIHGDEYEGPAAVIDLARVLENTELFGSVIAVPAMNPLAFEAGSRTNPSDGLNLARCFPGKSDGSPTLALASALFEGLAKGVDCLIDLHSGGVEYEFVPLAGFYGPPADDNPSYLAARAFGMPYVWELPRTEGVLSHEAWKEGAVTIGNEYLGAGRLSVVGREAYLAGILRCLEHWGICRGPFSAPPPCTLLRGDWQLSSQSGLFCSHVALDRHVTKGTSVASIVDRRGNILERFVAPRNALIAGLRSKAYIREQNWAVLYAEAFDV